MPYDHKNNAGNKGDVWKHAILVSIARHIHVAESFKYVESHSGAPFHSIASATAWRRGIGDILELNTSHPYAIAARAWIDKQIYPAGWKLFVDEFAQRCKDIQVVLCDTSREVANRYNELPSDFSPSHVDGIFKRQDGFAYVRDVSADLVFLDPPYSPHAASDWANLAGACNDLREHRVPHIAWYPIYWPTRPNELVALTGEIGFEVMWAEMGSKPSQNMKGCGMLLSPEMASILRKDDPELVNLASLLGSAEGPVERRPN